MVAGRGVGVVLQLGLEGGPDLLLLPAEAVDAQLLSHQTAARNGNGYDENYQCKTNKKANIRVADPDPGCS